MAFPKRIYILDEPAADPPLVVIRSMRPTTLTLLAGCSFFKIYVRDKKGSSSCYCDSTDTSAIVSNVMHVYVKHRSSLFSR